MPRLYGKREGKAQYPSTAWIWQRMLGSLWILACGMWMLWYLATSFKSMDPMGILFYFVLTCMAIYLGVGHLTLSLVQLLLVHLFRKGDYRLAQNILARTISLSRGSPLVSGGNLAYFESFLGSLLKQSGAFDIAETIYRRALEHAGEFVDPARADGILAPYKTRLASACVCTGKLEEATRLANEALRAVPNKFEEVLSLSLLSLVSLYDGNGQLAEQEALAAQAITKQLDVGKIGSQRLLQLRTMLEIQLTLACAMQRSFECSLEHYGVVMHHESIDDQASALVDPHILCLLAAEFLKQGLLIEAESILQIAYELGQWTPMDAVSQQTLKIFEELLIMTGRESELEEMGMWLRPARLKRIG